VYQGFWQMRNAQGRSFGTRVWVGIQVPQPQPPTPSTGIFFTADRTQVSPGQQVVFSWNVQNGVAQYFYADGQNWQQYAVAAIGQQAVFPQGTTTYNLRVVKTNGTTEIRQITIVVSGGSSAPVIQNFRLTPEYQITLGQCVAITWTVQGNVSRVRLLRNNTTLWDNAPSSGNTQDCPQQTGENVYTLQASGPGGSVQSQRVLNVISPVSQGPVINSFFVTPDQLPAGSCVTIQWNVSNATSVQITRNNVGLQQAFSSLSGTAQDCIPTTGYYVYQLQASNASGQLAVQQRAVTVFSPVYGATPQP
jgi:hypothetical protein